MDEGQPLPAMAVDSAVGGLPESARLLVPGAAQDANDFARAQVRVEVHHELGRGRHDDAERLRGRTAAADRAPVRTAGHHLVLLLMPEAHPRWWLDLSNSEHIQSDPYCRCLRQSDSRLRPNKCVCCPPMSPTYLLMCASDLLVSR
jgi:hypothetical protein